MGAGLTGLITAALLARSGKDVLVLEARTVGVGATGNTTAKISLLQGSKLSTIVAKHGPSLARQYLEGNREGQAWLLRHCENHGIAVQREDAYTYVQSADGVRTARSELDAARASGLDVEWMDDADVPFRSAAGSGCAIRPNSIQCRCWTASSANSRGPATDDLTQSVVPAR